MPVTIAAPKSQNDQGTAPDGAVSPAGVTVRGTALVGDGSGGRVGAVVGSGGSVGVAVGDGVTVGVAMGAGVCVKVGNGVGVARGGGKSVNGSTSNDCTT